MPEENAIENAPVETSDIEKVKKAPVSKQFTAPMPLVPQVEKMINKFRAEQKAKVDAARNAKKREAAQEKLRLLWYKISTAVLSTSEKPVLNHTEKLKPCPFCGEEDVKIVQISFFTIRERMELFI